MAIQTVSSVSNFIKLEHNLATDSILMHNPSCTDKSECVSGKESHDSHVLKYIKNKDSITICPHLIYSATGMLIYDVTDAKEMYCKFFDKLSEIGGDFLQILREELDDEHLILNFTTSYQSPLSRFFVVYNLGDLSKEKSYFNNDKNCKNWDVWGPTIEAVERKQMEIQQ